MYFNFRSRFLEGVSSKTNIFRRGGTVYYGERYVHVECENCRAVKKHILHNNYSKDKCENIFTSKV